MRDEALKALAAQTVSRKRAILLGTAVLLIVFLAAILFQSSDFALKWIRYLFVISLVAVAASLNWIRKIRPTPDSIPTLRVLRDQPEKIGAIVGVERGGCFLAVVDAGGKLLARPMEVVTATDEEAVAPSVRADEPTNPMLAAAVALALEVCPNARVAMARDNVGLKSLARLAREAASARS